MPDLKKMLTLEALSEALPSWLKRSTKPEYNADEIDSTLTTNQFVTASDKENWNAKGTYSKPSGGIPKSDLSSIVQTSLEKADSALQSETDPTVPSWAKQTNKPSYTQDEVADGSTYKRVTQTEKNTWNGKQNALTTTQMQAVNSGITSAGVAQISTNQTNILYALQTGANNLLDLSNATMVADSSLTVTKDGNSYVVNGNPSTSAQVTFTDFVPCVPITGGKIAVVGCPSGGSTQNGYSLRGYLDNLWKSTDSGLDTKEFTTSSINKIVLYFVGGHQYTNVRFTPMVVSEEVWNTLGSDYRPPALPNYDLTRLEAEDRASLAEVVDSGAKNLLDTPTVTVSDVTFTADSEHYITASPNNGDGRLYTYANCQYKLHLKKGTYVLALEIKTSTSSNNANVLVINTSNTEVATIPNWEVQNKTGLVYHEFTISTEADYGVLMKCYTMAARLMICTKAAFGVSKAFVPYRPNYDLVCDSLFPTSYTPITAATSAVASKISNIIGGYVKIGKLILINIRFTVTDSITTADLFTVPSAIRPSLVGGQAFSNGSMINVNSNETVPLVITTRDTVTNIGLPVNNTTPATNIGVGTYCISITYLGA